MDTEKKKTRVTAPHTGNTAATHAPHDSYPLVCHVYSSLSVVTLRTPS